MLSIFSIMIWNGLWFPLMLSIRENCLLVGWACIKIDYSLTEHAWKLVTRQLSMRENWLLASWAYEKIILVQHMHFQSFFPLYLISPIPLSPSPITVKHPLSPLSRLCTLSPSLCTLSYVSVPFLLSSVPCLKTLHLVSHPLYPLSRLCSLFPDLCTLSNTCPSVHFLVALFNGSCPLLLHLLSFSLVFHTCEDVNFLENIQL